jgi:hypothetical protein
LKINYLPWNKMSISFHHYHLYWIKDLTRHIKPFWAMRDYFTQFLTTVEIIQTQ